MKNQFFLFARKLYGYLLLFYNKMQINAPQSCPMVTSYEEYFLFIVNIIVALGIGVVVLAVACVAVAVVVLWRKKYKDSGW